MARTARPPVIAVMGHIDHGKSSLLDYIRKANIVADEAGGITQHVAAYIAIHNDRSITFLDTPGHEAFKALRTRGAAAADIAILVIAADEGVMPQTLDALSAIKEASIPFIIAITKIDKNNADIDRVKNSLLEHQIFIEGMGGDIAYALVSSKTGEGISELLDLVLLATDITEITTDPDSTTDGFVLESTQDPKRGSSATLIIKNGTLSLSGFVVAGDAFAPIRFIEDFHGKRIQNASPSEPVQISGFNKLPAAGSLFCIVETKKEAEALAKENAKDTVVPKRSAAIEGIMELPIIIKADTAGSVDAITHELKKITHERASIRIVSSGVGSISETDVKTAQASGGTLIAFNVSIDTIAAELASRDSIKILSFSIIYELSDAIKKLLTESVPTVASEKELGRALVLKAFSSNGKKQVLGARHISGILTVKDRIKIVRKGNDIARGNILNLQQARMDTKEIKIEGDFGIEIETKESPIYGDEIVTFVVTET